MKQLLTADHCQLITGAEDYERSRLEAGNAALRLGLRGTALFIQATACVTHPRLPVTIIKHFFRHFDVKLGGERDEEIRLIKW